MALLKKDKVNIIKAYRELTPMAQLAKEYSVSRQAIYKIIKKAGVPTMKGPYTVSCDCCGKPTTKTRSRIRKQKHVFCSMDCYKAFLQAGNGFPYIGNRNGQRTARSIVSQYFQLKEGYIVHHENRNALDNRLSNLKVFRNQGDHIRYHRGFDVVPIWDGASIDSFI